MDFVELGQRDLLSAHCDEFEQLLGDEKITELDIKRFIQNNRYYHIPASIFLYYDFGHHEAALFKEFPLGTDYRADYLLAGKGSGGWQFIYVEFESPYGSVIKKDGNYGSVIHNGLNQVDDWEHFLGENYFPVTAEFEKRTNRELPKEFINYDSTRMHYVVVAGRREDFQGEKPRYQQRKSSGNNKRIIHYDNLLDRSKELVERNTY